MATTNEPSGSDGRSTGEVASVAAAAAADAETPHKKRKVTCDPRDDGGGNGESNGNRHAATERKAAGASGEAGNRETGEEDACWIKIPKRPSLFAAAETWWMVDLHARPVPKQGATPLVRRCMRALGWSETLARTNLRAYRQFLHVKATKRDWNAELLSPSAAVDQVWHQHLLDNSNYAHDCLLLCGHFIRHDPDGGLDVEARKNRLEATRKALLECFGDEGGALDRSATGPWKEVFGVTLEPPQSSTARSSGPTAAAAQASDGDSGAQITIVFRDQRGEVTSYRVGTTIRLGKVFNAYAQRMGEDVSEFRFLLGGEAALGEMKQETLRSLGLENGVQFDVVREQTGC